MGSSMGNLVNAVPSLTNTPSGVSSTPENTVDTDKTCFINTQRDLKLKQTLMKKNVIKFNIKKEIKHVIVDEIDRISDLVLNEKTLNSVLLKSKNPEDKPKIQTIRTIKDKLIHNYVFVIKKTNPEYGELYTKSLTIQILQNIKLYLINIAKMIVNTAKEQSATYGLPMLLLTLLEDNGIKGFLRTIGRNEQYYIYTKELKRYKRTKNIPQVELHAVAFLTYIYYYIASTPTLKSSGGVDLKRTHNYMKQLNSGLMQTYFRGGSLTDMTSAMSGLANMNPAELTNHVVKQQVSSYLDPQNRYVDTVVKDYVGSVISSVKKKINTYDLYKPVKVRLNTDASELRITLLFCVLEMFKGKAFRLFLNRLLQENDILKQPTNAKPMPQADEDDNKFVANDVILKLFLQKLTDDLNKPANEFSKEVVSKYTNLISGINSSKDAENDIAQALRVNVKKTGGGNRWNSRLRTVKVYNRRTKHSFKTIQHTPKKRHPHKRNTARRM